MIKYVTIIMLFFYTNNYISQTLPLSEDGMMVPRTDVYEEILIGLYGDDVKWGLHFFDYYFSQNKMFLQNDTISKITSINKETLINYYESWKINDDYIFRKCAPFLNNELKNKWLKKKRSKVISVSGMLFLPDKYILMMIREYCKGVCMTETLYLLEYKSKANELEVIFSKIIDVS